MAEKITKSEFISRIKTKHPDYKDVDDDILFDKILTKYPEYKEGIIDEEPLPDESLSNIQKETVKEGEEELPWYEKIYRSVEEQQTLADAEEPSAVDTTFKPQFETTVPESTDAPKYQVENLQNEDDRISARIADASDKFIKEQKLKREELEKEAAKAGHSLTSFSPETNKVLTIADKFSDIKIRENEDNDDGVDEEM